MQDNAGRRPSISKSAVRRNRPGSRLVNLELDAPGRATDDTSGIETSPPIGLPDHMEGSFQSIKFMRNPSQTDANRVLELVDDTDGEEQETTDDAIYENTSAHQTDAQDLDEPTFDDLATKMVCCTMALILVA